MISEKGVFETNDNKTRNRFFIQYTHTSEF